MKHTCVVMMLCALWVSRAAGACSVPNNIQSADVRRLAPELIDTQQSAQARDSLAKLATSDPSVMADLENAVPFWIVNCTGSSVWVNAARLAESLKLTAAVPALVQALDRKYYESPIITATTALRLDYDTVGRALVAIGDPAIPALSKRWNQLPDPAQRSRVADILFNIGSPAALKALQWQSAKETDPWVKGIINARVQWIQSRSH